MIRTGFDAEDVRRELVALGMMLAEANRTVAYAKLAVEEAEIAAILFLTEGTEALSWTQAEKRARTDKKVLAAKHSLIDSRYERDMAEVRFKAAMAVGRIEAARPAGAGRAFDVDPEDYDDGYGGGSGGADGTV